MEPSADALRNGLDMLEREMGLRSEGRVIEKLLGGAAPRIDLRGLAGIPVRLASVFVLDAGAEGLSVVAAPVRVALERSDAIDSCDSLRCKGRETRLAVEPMCSS